MLKSPRSRIAVGVTVAAAVVGAGGAIAATKLSSPQEQSKAIVADAAQQLGVTSAQLTDALRTAMKKQIDAQVAAGSLTKAQADELKARIDAGNVPLVGVGPGRGFGHEHMHGFHGAGLDAAATYLGVTEAQLRTSLESGKTLADVAKSKDKSVDGLVAAMVKAARADLAQAVSDGKLTQAQADAIAAGLQQRITDMVNGTGGPGPGRGMGMHRGGPPAFAGPMA